jgi:hypothetical protein
VWNQWGKSRLLRSLALGLAVSAVAAPVAQARVDGNTDWSGPGMSENVSRSITTYPDAVAGGAAESYGLVVQRDGSVRSITDYQFVRSINVYPDSAAAEAARSYGPLAASSTLVSAPEGFDWGDGGIGAGLAFAVLLVGAGASVATRRIGRAATT